MQHLGSSRGGSSRGGLSRRAALAFAAAAAGAAGDRAEAQDSPAFQAVLDGARAERRLVARSSLPSTRRATQALAAAFNRRFGLATRVEWLPVAAVTANTRAIAEAASGKVNMDIIGGAAVDEAHSLKSRGLLSPLDWAGTRAGPSPCPPSGAAQPWSGLVARLIARHGANGLSAAPPSAGDRQRRAARPCREERR